MSRIIVVVGSAVLLAACSSSTSAPVPSPSGAPHDEAGVHWSYSGEGGPDNWGDLSPDFAECSTGDRQSPIEIDAPDEVKRASPEVDYITQTAYVVNNGHTVEASAGPGNVLKVGGEKYALVRMHFHAPAENVIDGVRYPAELHFVHEGRDGSGVVLAVMLAEGAENPAFDPYLDHMDDPLEAEAEATLPWSGMVPKDTRSIRFDGSLTTPDCTEGIAWNVAVTPVEVSAQQLDELRAAYDDNSRPVQPLNGREVTIDAK